MNALRLGWGADGPEDYSRIFHEAVHDPKIGYRETSRKILINFADSIPHDDNIYESLGSTYKKSYGGDPGRDGVMFTGDDVDLQSVLNQMKNDKITLFNINSGGSWLQPFWKA